MLTVGIKYSAYSLETPQVYYLKCFELKESIALPCYACVFTDRNHTVESQVAYTLH